MPLTVICDCGHRFRVADELAGRKGKCSSCGKVLTVPMVGEAESPPRPARNWVVGVGIAVALAAVIAVFWAVFGSGDDPNGGPGESHSNDSTARAGAVGASTGNPEPARDRALTGRGAREPERSEETRSDAPERVMPEPGEEGVDLYDAVAANRISISVTFDDVEARPYDARWIVRQASPSSEPLRIVVRPGTVVQGAENSVTMFDELRFEVGGSGADVARADVKMYRLWIPGPEHDLGTTFQTLARPTDLMRSVCRLESTRSADDTSRQVAVWITHGRENPDPVYRSTKQLHVRYVSNHRKKDGTVLRTDPFQITREKWFATIPLVESELKKFSAAQRAEINRKSAEQQKRLQEEVAARVAASKRSKTEPKTGQESERPRNGIFAIENPGSCEGDNVTLCYLEKRGQILRSLKYQWRLSGPPQPYAMLRDAHYREALAEVDAMEAALVKSTGRRVDLNLRLFFELERAMFLQNVRDRERAMTESVRKLKEAYTNGRDADMDPQMEAALGGLVELWKQQAKFRFHARIVQESYRELQSWWKKEYGANVAERMAAAFQSADEAEYLSDEATAWMQAHYPNVYPQSLLPNPVAPNVPAEALELAKSEGREAKALIRSGHALQFGKGVDPDPKQALLHYHAAASLGSAEGQYLTGAMYENGTGVKQDYDAARAWYAMAARNKFARAGFRLGAMVFDGKAAPANPREASLWFEWAADRGDPEAAFAQGMIFYKGVVGRKNYEMAHELFSKAAQKKYPPAQHQLGDLYNRGRGVRANAETSLDWYTRAANQGFSPSIGVLGVYYETQEDYRNALKWYRKGAELGNGTGIYGMGSLYYHGNGVKQDKKKALDWWIRSANQGATEAQKNVRRMLQKGDGVPADPARLQELRASWPKQRPPSLDPFSRMILKAGIRSAIESLREDG